MSEPRFPESLPTPRRVLHVLPEPGGGGETYADQLDSLPGYGFDRFHLTRDARPRQVPGGLVRLGRSIGEYDLVHVHGDSAALVCLPLLRRRPTVITLHGAHLMRRSSGVRARLLRAGLRRAFARAAMMIAVSDSERVFAAQLVPGAADRIALVRNGVPDPGETGEAARAGAREALGLPADAVAVLFAGELTERKQPLQLASAIDLARAGEPDLVGLFAGDGPLAPELAARAGEGVRPLGHCGDVSDLLAASDVFALPSLREGLSYALLEAMAQGKATLVSDAPGNPDAVGDAGLVVGAGDVEGLAAALTRLAAEPELRAELGRAARRRVRERFSLESMLEGTARVYERALGAGP
jgi:glycosyltransferase involved in cell wall biosynthesis